LPKELALDLGSSSGLGALIGSHVRLELVLIPAGRFVMGSPSDEKGRSELECLPVKVTMSRPCYMGKYPVTQEQYQKIMGRNFSDTRGPRNPVERVSWNDATDFCRKLGALTGQAVRLPTMAEWEYACRAGTTTRFCSGDSDSALNRVGWYEGNSGRSTHPVGQKASNAWGLYDMHGNVYEWCRDVSGGKDYFGSGPVTDPVGPENPGAHALCGGCWGSSADDCRSAAGMECSPEPRNNVAGFRVVVDIPHSEYPLRQKP
jgi:formylglycine-generating enzyme required for sulfatase activity